MCRLLGYLGPSIQLDSLLIKPEHSLIAQSYQPREMTAGLINADGFGVGWYHPQREIDPFVYKNTSPIWSDVNLPHLSRYIESGCILANVRSATIGQAVQLSNCQPYRCGRLLGMHNGFIKNFRQTLYRPIRDRLSDTYYQAIEGTTDSEHVFALLCNELQTSPDSSLEAALKTTLHTLAEWTNTYQVTAALNFLISDGYHLVASRFACTGRLDHTPILPPSLYWLRDDSSFAKGIIVASEPIFASSQWTSCPENSILVIGEDLDIETYQL
jgi:glutamine amidotransferase